MVARERRLGYFLLVPFIILVIGIQIYPILYAFMLSFTDKGLFSREMHYIGLGNFIDLFQSFEFWSTLKNNFIYAGSCVLFQTIVGLMTSLLLVRRFVGNYIARAILTFPYLIPTIVAVLLFKWMFNDLFGVVNHLMVNFGLLEQGIGWFGIPRAMFSVILISVWRFFPFTILLFIPGLQAIPRELYEAAKVDGASPFQQFIHITIPQIKEVLAVIIILRGIWMFNNFNVIWLSTRGGPVGTTQHLPILSYLQAFRGFEVGQGAATSTVGLIILLIPLVIYLRWSSE